MGTLEKAVAKVIHTAILTAAATAAERAGRRIKVQPKIENREGFTREVAAGTLRSLAAEAVGGLGQVGGDALDLSKENDLRVQLFTRSLSVAIERDLGQVREMGKLIIQIESRKLNSYIRYVTAFRKGYKPSTLRGWLIRFANFYEFTRAMILGREYVRRIGK